MFTRGRGPMTVEDMLICFDRHEKFGDMSTSRLKIFSCDGASDIIVSENREAIVILSGPGRLRMDAFLRMIDIAFEDEAMGPRQDTSVLLRCGGRQAELYDIDFLFKAVQLRASEDISYWPPAGKL